MGADESKSPGSSGSPSFASTFVDFPNSCRRESEAVAWTLLHQCNLDRWKEGHAEAAGFRETVLSCDGSVHKDCSFSFCMSRQGIINIDKASSLFSFRKRSKFAKMAEHFEYNYIPAQLSSIHHFRVNSVLCFRESLVVLHLTRNTTSQFGLLELRNNKFIGVFGKQRRELSNEGLFGEISPDKSKCLIKLPNDSAGRVNAPQTILQLYDLHSFTLLTEFELPALQYHFCFDPRFTWKHIVITNFGPTDSNTVSVVSVDTWSVLKRKSRVNDTRNSLYPFLKDMRFTKDGSLIIAVLLETNCYCRERKTRNYRPINCSIYVFSADSMDTIHCIEYQRFTCTRHYCPVNYTPVFSCCGNRMAVVMNTPDLPNQHFVQIYKLPTALNLQNMCRIVILQQFPPEFLCDLPLPLKLINYLHFKPEFE